jgi:hypothetical protein
MISKIEKAIRELHFEVSEVIDIMTNGDEITYRYQVPQCLECRVEWPCMTITVLEDALETKATGAFIPDINCDECQRDDVACIEHYMANGGFND